VGTSRMRGRNGATEYDIRSSADSIVLRFW